MRSVPFLLALLAALPAAAREPLHLTEREATRLAGLRVEIRDLRVGSPAFGRGVSAALLADTAWFSAQQPDARRIAPGEDTGLPPEAFEAWAARTGGFCRVTMGGPHSVLSAPEAAARMAGVLHPDGAPDAARLILRSLDTAALDRFTLDHEVGHCRDARLRFATLSALTLSGSGPRIAESRHAFEVFADTIAALEFLRAVPVPDAVAVLREIGNLRQISVVTNFRRGTLGRDGRIVLAPSLAYHTAPAIDAVLALAQARGLAWLRARSANEVLALAEAIRADHGLSRADQAALTSALADTRMRVAPHGAEFVFSPDLPRVFQDRFATAAREQAFRAAPHEAPPMTRPTARHLATAAQPLLDGTPWLRSALDPDLRDGARVVRVAPLPGGAYRVALRERDGARGTIVVRPDGDVIRSGPAGRIASLAIDRPALLRTGTALHVVADEMLGTEAAEAWFTGPLETTAP